MFISITALPGFSPVFELVMLSTHGLKVFDIIRPTSPNRLNMVHLQKARATTDFTSQRILELTAFISVENEFSDTWGNCFSSMYHCLMKITFVNHIEFFVLDLCYCHNSVQPFEE